MTLSEFREVLLEKSVGRTVLPEDSKLKARILTGLKMIALETVPLRLIVQDPAGHTILRRTDEGMFIRTPSRPTSEDSEIDTDLALTDALAYYVMAGLERAVAKTHMGMYHGQIDLNNDRLIETFLSTTTNDSDKYCQYP